MLQHLTTSLRMVYRKEDDNNKYYCYNYFQIGHQEYFFDPKLYLSRQE